MRHILMLYVSLNEASVTEDFSCRGHVSFETKRVSTTLLPFNYRNILKEVSQTDFVLLCPISASRCWTPLHRKLIQIQNRKNLRTTVRTDGLTERHIILSLRGFDHVACGRMRCAHIWAARMNFNYRSKPLFQKKNMIKFIY